MDNFKIANNNMICLHGFKIPESAVYGKYNGKLFVCIDLRVKGIGKGRHFSVYTYEKVGIRSVWTKTRKPVRREEQVYLYDNWKLDSIPLNSILGKYMFHYSLSNPLIIPRGEYPDRKSNEVVFRTSRPKYNNKRNIVPDGVQSGKVFSA